MKIIEQPRMQSRCGDCFTLVEIEAADVSSVQGDRCAYECPGCQREVTIKFDALPPAMVERILTKNVVQPEKPAEHDDAGKASQ